MEPRPSKLRRALALILLAALAWQTVTSAWLIGALFVRDVATEGMFETEELRLQRALGEHWETFVALRDNVPEHGTVFLNLERMADHPKAVESAFLLMRLRHSLHPRAVWGFDFHNAALVASVAGEQDLGVCLIDPEEGEAPPSTWTQVAGNERFQLWRAP